MLIGQLSEDKDECRLTINIKKQNICVGETRDKLNLENDQEKYIDLEVSLDRNDTDYREIDEEVVQEE